jgi:hypothetical protein
MQIVREGDGLVRRIPVGTSSCDDNDDDSDQREYTGDP